MVGWKPRFGSMKYGFSLQEEEHEHGQGKWDGLKILAKEVISSGMQKCMGR
jgi:hypothetical protein